MRLDGWTRFGADCHVSHGAALGGPPQDLKYRAGTPTFLEFGERNQIREFVTANLATEPGTATRVGSDCLLMAYSHVAHDCSIGDQVVVANAVQFAGYVAVEDWAIVGGATVVHQFVRIGCHAMVGGGSRISQDVAPYVKCAGSPPRLAGTQLDRARAARCSPNRFAARLDRAYRMLFRDGLTITEAVARMRTEYAGIAEVERLARFAETSVRGLTR